MRRECTRRAAALALALLPAGAGRAASAPEPALVLNGAGASRIAFIDLYQAELYLPRKSSSAAEVLAMAGPMRLQMHIRFAALSGERIAGRLAAGLQANLDARQFERAQPHIRAIAALLQAGPRLTRGDTLAFEFEPGDCVRFRVNGVLRGSVQDPEFPTALLRVWLGGNPVNPALKAALLGTDHE